jgi:hypothetical protein
MRIITHQNVSHMIMAPFPADERLWKYSDARVKSEVRRVPRSDLECGSAAWQRAKAPRRHSSFTMSNNSSLPSGVTLFLQPFHRSCKRCRIKLTS